jgi:hypothetical protein
MREWWQEMVSWWAAVPAEFAFLLLLPFAVALAALAGECWRKKKR